MAFPDIPATLPDFAGRFTTEDACAIYLFDLRWPSGFVCPKCGHTKGFFIKGRMVTECGNRGCGHQSSLTAGTILHGTRQDLRTWFWAVYLVSTLTPGISALEFQEQLGLSRYETAFTMLHKLRAALVAPGREPLSGEVEVDEGYIGGPEKGHPGRGADRKSLVVGAVEIIKQHGRSGKPRVCTGRIRLRIVPDASAGSLVPFVKESIAKGSTVHTDGWPSYSGLATEGYIHRATVQGSGKDAKYMPHVHRIISNVKTWLLGTHHGRVDPKHLQAYLNEYTYRFNRRFWRGPAFHRALELIVKTSDTPTYDGLYHSGMPDSTWTHPYSHGTYVSA